MDLANGKCYKKATHTTQLQPVALDPGTADAKFGDSVCVPRNNPHVVIVSRPKIKSMFTYPKCPIDLKPIYGYQKSKVVDVGELVKLLLLDKPKIRQNKQI